MLHLTQPDRRRYRPFLLIIAFSILAMATMGYHPGLEDDGVYLSAIKSDLNPVLYPHDARFFRLQLQATVFDKLMAAFVRFTHIPVAWTELLFQFLSIALILCGCWRIANILFEDEWVRWAGVMLCGAMLTLPVAGTALYLADQHLHPRNLATGLILVAVSRILASRPWQAVMLLFLACLLHPLMGIFGISFCFFLAINVLDPVHAGLRRLGNSVSAAVPLGWIFESPTPAWRRALETRRYFFLYRWTWYEWLGAIGPLILFWLLWRTTKERGQIKLAHFATAVLAFGVFHLMLAMTVLGIPALVRLTPLQPMRFLHLVYFFMTLIGGCLAGQYVLKRRAWRWALFLLAINAIMFTSQRELYPDSPHMELPGVRSGNVWLQAFAWVRENTPTDAYFAMDPNYLAAPGEDYHSFRALAERSQLADAVKDASVATQVPELSVAWEEQVDATNGWQNFRLGDFERLKREFGVDWVLVSYPAPEGLSCRWHSDRVSVCRIP